MPELASLQLISSATLGLGVWTAGCYLSKCEAVGPGIAEQYNVLAVVASITASSLPAALCIISSTQLWTSAGRYHAYNSALICQSANMVISTLCEQPARIPTRGDKTSEIAPSPLALFGLKGEAEAEEKVR